MTDRRRSARETAKERISAKRTQLAAQLASVLRERIRMLEDTVSQGIYESTGSIAFIQKPTDTLKPFEVQITFQSGVKKPAVLDPDVCRGKGALAQHTKYSLCYMLQGEKVHILSYRDCTDRDAVSDLYIPDEDIALEKCMEPFGEQLKLALVECGVIRDLRHTEKGSSFRLDCGGYSYSCYAARDGNDTNITRVMVEGERHIVQGILCGKTLHVYSCLCTAQNGDMTEEIHGMARGRSSRYPDIVTVNGIVCFDDSPDPRRDIFRFTLKKGREVIRMRLRRSTMQSDVPIVPDTQMSFECTRSTQGIYTINRICASGSGWAPNHMRKFPEEMKCGTPIYINAELVPIAPRMTADGPEFSVVYMGKRYNCIASKRIKECPHDILPLITRKYHMELVLMGELAYLVSAVDIGQASADDLHTNKPDKPEKPEKRTNSERLSPAKRLEVERMKSERERHAIVSEDERARVFLGDDIVEKFLACKEFYPPDIQRAIANIRRNDELKPNQRRSILDILINTPWSRRLELNSDPEKLRAKLDETHYGQDYLKGAIVKLFLAYAEKRGKKGEAILAVGAPGVGKTSIFQAAAKAFGIPCAKISLNGVDTPLFLKGTPRLYDNAICGKIMRTLRRVGDRSMIILDEVDKMGQGGRDGSPSSALYDLLDPNEKFQDSFIEEGIDLGDTLFVLTANDIANVPPAILDRVTVIHVPDYTPEERCVIAANYVIPREISKYSEQGIKIHWTEQAIEEIALRFTLTNGVRDIERNVSAVVRSVLEKMKREKLTSFEVNQDNVCALADMQPCRRDTRANSISEIKNKFRFFKFHYAPEVSREVISMLAKYEASHDESEREMLRRCMAVLVNLLPEPEKKGFSIESVKAALDRTHFGMDKVKEQMLIALAGINASGANGVRCLLLDGPCGVGKTSICKTVADAMGRAFVKISLNGIDTPQFIRGFERTWENSDCGAVVKRLSECGTDAAVVLLDEIDKINCTNGRDPYSALLDLMDDSGMFTDTFLGVPLDLRNVLFIATSNVRGNIPTALIDRMEIIELSGYSEAEKLRIACTHILPGILAKYRAESICFEESAVEYITESYCKAFGMRDVSRALDRIVRTIIKENICGKDITRVTTSTVKRILGARPLVRGNVAPAERMRPGIARALAVGGNSGSTFAIQVTENPFGRGDEITGLPGRSTVDSIKIAKLLVSRMLCRELGPVHVHFAEGGIEKDGPSAGITLFSAMYSYFSGLCIPRDVAFTGEIDIFGDVWAIGGVELKLRAAECEGCTRVFIPRENYTRLQEDDLLGKYAPEVIPVDNVEEICDILFSSAARTSA